MSVTSAQGWVLLFLFLFLAFLAVCALVVFLAERKTIVRWIRAHTTASERKVAENIAHGVVVWVAHFATSPEGQARFIQACDILTIALRACGIFLPIGTIQQVIQDAYSILKASGVIAASEGKAHPTPPASGG